MTLPLPTTVDDPATQENHDRIAQQFPIQAQNIANGAVGSKALAKASVTDEKLSKPVIAGVVKESGEKESGEGFTVERPATGEYKITLSTELGTLGALVATPTGLLFPSAPASKKVFVVTFFSTTAVKTNTVFSFHIKAT